METLESLREKFWFLTNGCVGDFSFEAGWIPLLSNLAEEIGRLEAVCREGFSIFQIKEKYGRLSIQSSAGPEIEELIYAAENASLAICAICSGKGDLAENGWRRVLCLPHRLACE